MQDQVIKGTGNSRYLKSNIPTTTTHNDLITMLRAGTFPVDFNGINSAGIQTQGTPLNKSTLLNDSVAQKFAYNGTPQTPNEVFNGLTLLQGNSSPAQTLDALIGQLYLDTSTSSLYICTTHVADPVYTRLSIWQKIYGVDTISPSITKTAGNSTVAITAGIKDGHTVQLGLRFDITDSITEGSNIFEGTLSNYLPMAYISTASYYGVSNPSAGILRITAAGEMLFRLVKGSLSNGATMYAGLTYITAS